MISAVTPLSQDHTLLVAMLQHFLVPGASHASLSCPEVKSFISFPLTDLASFSILPLLAQSSESFLQRLGLGSDF